MYLGIYIHIYMYVYMCIFIHTLLKSPQIDKEYVRVGRSDGKGQNAVIILDSQKTKEIIFRSWFSEQVMWKIINVPLSRTMERY